MAPRLWVNSILVFLLLWAENADAAPCDGIAGALFMAEVPENSVDSHSVFTIPVDGTLGEITLNITPMNVFKLQGKEVQVGNSTALDREILGQDYVLTVTCNFGADIQQGFIAIKILDVNEYDPTFINIPYTWNIPEFSLVPTTFDVPATDGDGGNILYSLDASVDTRYFSIPLPNRGQISLIKALNYEALPDPTIYVIVYAKDSNPSGNNTGYPIRTGSATVTINVIDQDDQPPIFLPPNCDMGIPTLCQNPEYNTSVRENVLEHDIVFTPGPIKAEDGDKGIDTPIKYKMLRDNDFFVINEDSGQITMTQPAPSKTTTPEIKFQIAAYQQDDIQKYTITTVTIEVVRINENPPVFHEEEYCGYVPNNADIVFATICDSPNNLQLQVTDADYPAGESPSVVYTLTGTDAANFQIHSSGYILVHSSSLIAGEEYTLQVEARDVENGDKARTRLIIKVQAETTTAPTTTNQPTTTTTTTTTTDVATTTRHVTANTGTSVTTLPGGDVSPTTRPGGNVSPTTGPSDDLTTTTTSGGYSVTTARTDRPISSSNRPESVTPGVDVTTTKNPNPESTTSGPSPAVTTAPESSNATDNPEQSTASTLSRPTGGTPAVTTPPGAVSSFTTRPGQVGTTEIVTPGPTSQTPPGSDRPTDPGTRPTAEGSDRPTDPGPRPPTGGSDRPTTTVRGPYPTTGGPSDKIYTAQDLAIVGGVLGGLLAVALGVIAFLLFKLLYKPKKFKIEEYENDFGEIEDHANSRKENGHQDDISIVDLDRDDDPNLNHYIQLPKDLTHDTDVDRSSGYNSVSGRPVTPVQDEPPSPPQPHDNPTFVVAEPGDDPDPGNLTKSILVTTNSNEKASVDKAGYKAVWFKDEVIPDGGEAADEPDGDAGVRFASGPAEADEGQVGEGVRQLSSGAPGGGGGGPHGLESGAAHVGGLVPEEDEFASL